MFVKVLANPKEATNVTEMEDADVALLRIREMNFTIHSGDQDGWVRS